MADLPIFPAGTPIVDPKTGLPTAAFVTWIAAYRAGILSEFGALEAADAAQAAADLANAAAATATAAAATANTAAETAQNATDDNARFLSLYNSNTTGLTVTATDAGVDATITMSAHTRNYADGTSVAVSGGAVTGLAYSTQYFIYYDQASLAGGAVTYHAVTSGPDAYATAAGGSAPDRHYVGSVVTPAAAGLPVPGTQAQAVSFDQPIGGNWL